MRHHPKSICRSIAFVWLGLLACSAEGAPPNEGDSMLAVGEVASLADASALPIGYDAGPVVDLNARVHLDVPADAQLVVNGYFIPGHGRYRYLQVPANAPGTMTPIQVFTSTDWDSSGQSNSLQIKRMLRLFPGQLVMVRAWPNDAPADAEDGAEDSEESTETLGGPAETPADDAASHQSAPVPPVQSPEVDDVPTHDSPQGQPTVNLPACLHALQHTAAKIRYANASAEETANDAGPVVDFNWGNEDLRILVPHPFRITQEILNGDINGKITYEIKLLQAENPSCDAISFPNASVTGEHLVDIRESHAIINHSLLYDLKAKIRNNLKLGHNATAIVVEGKNLTIEGLSKGTDTHEIKVPILCIQLCHNQCPP